VQPVYWLASLGIALAAAILPTGTQAEGGAASLLQACRLYVQDEVRGQRLRLERGVCIGTIETVLLLQRPLRAFYRFCPPGQLTLLEAVRTVVNFSAANKDLDRQLHEFAIEAFQQRWPCTD
jgi:hypothetical protein